MIVRILSVFIIMLLATTVSATDLNKPGYFLGTFSGQATVAKFKGEDSVTIRGLTGGYRFHDEILVSVTYGETAEPALIENTIAFPVSVEADFISTQAEIRTQGWWYWELELGLAYHQSEVLLTREKSDDFSISLGTGFGAYWHGADFSARMVRIDSDLKMFTLQMLYHF